MLAVRQRFRSTLVFLLTLKANTMKKISALIALTTFSVGIATAPVTWAAGTHDHSPKFGGIVAQGKAFDAELVATPD